MHLNIHIPTLHGFYGLFSPCQLAESLHALMAVAQTEMQIWYGDVFSQKLCVIVNNDGFWVDCIIIIF